MIINLFDQHFNEIKRKYDTYNIYSTEKNISFIMGINYLNIFEQDTEMVLKTIINGYNSDVEKIINI